MTPRIEYLIYFIVYQSGWLTCMLLAARQHGVLAIAVLAVSASIRMGVWRYCHPTVRLATMRDFIAPWRLVLLMVLGGILMDSIYVSCHAIEFAANPFAGWLSPPWMWMLWLDFALLFVSALGFLHTRYMLTALLALPGFAFAYAGGVRLQAAILPYGYLTCIAIGLTAACLLPLCLLLSQHIVSQRNKLE